MVRPYDDVSFVLIISKEVTAEVDLADAVSKSVVRPLVWLSKILPLFSVYLLQTSHTTAWLNMGFTLSHHAVHSATRRCQCCNTSKTILFHDLISNFFLSPARFFLVPSTFLFFPPCPHVPFPPRLPLLSSDELLSLPLFPYHLLSI